MESEDEPKQETTENILTHTTGREAGDSFFWSWNDGFDTNNLLTSHL